MTETVKRVYLSDLHFEHTFWIKELLFWEDQISIFRKRLEEIVSRYTANEIRAKVEHFQNQFILHEDVIDVLKKDIKKHEQQLAHYAEEHPVAIHHVHFDDHTDLRERMETQKSIYTDLKNNFFRFMSDTM